MNVIYMYRCLTLIKSNKIKFQMPCWYFEKKEIRNTPSIQDGLDHATEARYRREGARFIIDAGTKMGLYPCSYLDSLN